MSILPERKPEYKSENHSHSTLKHSKADWVVSSQDNPAPCCGRTKDADCTWLANLEAIYCHTHFKDGSTSSFTYQGRTYNATGEKKDGYVGTSEFIWVDRGSKERWQKPVTPKARPGQRVTFVYMHANTGEPLMRVERVDKGNGGKDFYPYFFNPATKSWSEKAGINKELEPYVLPFQWTHELVKAAVINGDAIFLTEGEGKAKALLDKCGIPAISLHGGSNKYGKGKGNYDLVQTLLKGVNLVLCPDRDVPGLKGMGAIAADFSKAQWLYAEPDSWEWSNLPLENGFDVKDWLDQGATKKQILAAVGEKRQLAEKGKSPKVVPIKGFTPVAGEELRARVDELQDRGLSGSELAISISELASSTGRQTRELWDLYHQREQEREAEETREERKGELASLLRIAKHKIKLKDYLYPVLAKPLALISEGMGVPEAVSLYTLLPTVASLCKIGTRLEIVSSLGFYAKPILYCGIVAESGSAKSPIMGSILKPLQELQAEVDKAYAEALAQFEDDLEAWNSADRKNRGVKPKLPLPREYFVKDMTPEAVAQIQGQQPDQGFLNWQDELSAIVNGRGKYTGGKGTDKENLLSGKDGSGIKVNRASGKRISVTETSLSIVGGTQPDTLKKMMGDFSDGAGEWARFLWTLIPLQARPLPKDSVTHDISELLKALYTNLEALPAATYKMSPEAYSLYADWHDKLDRKRLDEPKQALRSVYSKMQSDTGVLMLLLHLTNSLLEGKSEPALLVSAETAKQAISLAKASINSVRQIHLLGVDGKTDQTPLLQKVIELSQRKGFLTASDVKRGIWECKASTEEIRGMFQDLVAMGHGEIQGTGRTLKWSIIQEPTQSSKTATPEPTILTEPPASDTQLRNADASSQVVERGSEAKKIVRASDGVEFRVGEMVNLVASVDLDEWDWVNIQGIAIEDIVNGYAKLHILESPHPLEMLQKRTQTGGV